MAKNQKMSNNNIRDISTKLTHMDKTTPKKTGDGNGGDSLDTRVTRLEVKVDHLQSDVTEIKSDLKDFRKEVNAKFDKIDAKFDTLFYWIIGTLLASLGSIVSAVLVPIILHSIK